MSLEWGIGPLCIFPELEYFLVNKNLICLCERMGVNIPQHTAGERAETAGQHQFPPSTMASWGCQVWWQVSLPSETSHQT